MTTIWHRDWELTLGTVRITPRVGTALDISFESEKSLERGPNTATVRVINLGKNRRNSVSVGQQVELKAGYTDLVSTIFVGEIKHIYSERDGTEVITTIEAQDAGNQYRTTEIHRSYNRGTPVVDVARDAVDAMGIGVGNFGQYDFELSSGGDNFAEGHTLSGPAWRALDEIVRSSGLRWSVQDGVLQLREPGQPAERTAIRLSPGTGLIGSPTRDVGGNRRTNEPMVVNAVAQLIPGLYPGRVVVLESTECEGNYRVKRASTTGDTSADDWQVELTMDEY